MWYFLPKFLLAIYLQNLCRVWEKFLRIQPDLARNIGRIRTGPSLSRAPIYPLTWVWILARGNIPFSHTPRHSLANWVISGILETVDISTFQFIFGKIFKWWNVPQGILFYSPPNLNHNIHDKCVYFWKYGGVLKRCTGNLNGITDP